MKSSLTTTKTYHEEHEGREVQVQLIRHLLLRDLRVLGGEIEAVSQH
jgi:hypothetical protein